MKDKTLNVFDFDDTLFRIPNHTTDLSFDLNDDVHTWYDNPISLDYEKYRVQLISTIADYVSNAGEDDTTIILTKRVPKLIPHIQRLLDLHGVVVESIIAIGHEGHKFEVINEYTETCEYNRVRIFEDSLVQVVEYNLNLERPNYIDFEFFFVDKTHILKLLTIDAFIVNKLTLHDSK